MSDSSYFNTPDSPPPPAYEFCQQEFDQKVSHALEASQAEQQRVADAQDEEWEVWNEAAFLAAASSLAISDEATSPGASSSRSPSDASGSATIFNPQQQPTNTIVGNGKARSDYDASARNERGSGASPANVQPLRIVKKSTQTPIAGSGKKERPSWLEEAQLGGPPTPPAHRTVDDRPAVYRSDTLRSMQSATPPPEFTPVGPSLDGPPYEGPTPQPSGIVLTYVPGDSRPNSPLHSPIAAQTHLPYRPLSPAQFAPLQPRNSGRRSLPQPPPSRSYSSSPAAQNRATHQSLPTPPRISPQSNHRPTASYSVKQSYVVPRMTFDPRVAYANEKSSYSELTSQEPPPERIDAASLYSSAVSSLYSSSISIPPPPPPPRINNPASLSNLSPYSNFSAAQSHSSYHLPQPTAPAASSYSLHQYPDRGNAASPAPSEMSTFSRHSAHSQQSIGRPGHQSQPSGYRSGTVYQPTTYQSQVQTAYHTQPSYQPQYQSSYQPTSY